MLTERRHTAPGRPPEEYGHNDQAITELVDALVEAVDLNRWSEIDRLRSALDPFRATALFDAELRLNGTASADYDCICGGEWL